jgi:hypothetical protein
MLILSTWTAGSGTIAAPAQPAVISVYTLTSWNIAVDLPSTITGRVPLNIAAPAATLAQIAADYRFPQLSLGVPVQLGDYQQAMLSCHNLRLAQITIPVTVNSTTYQVPATLNAVAVLESRLAEINAGSASVKVTLPGLPSTSIPAATFKTAFAAYISGLRAVVAAQGTGTVDHVAIHDGIVMASTIATLDGIVIN